MLIKMVNYHHGAQTRRSDQHKLVELSYVPASQAVKSQVREEKAMAKSAQGCQMATNFPLFLSYGMYINSKAFFSFVITIHLQRTSFFIPSLSTNLSFCNFFFHRGIFELVDNILFFQFFFPRAIKMNSALILVACAVVIASLSGVLCVPVPQGAAQPAAVAQPQPSGSQQVGAALGTIAGTAVGAVKGVAEDIARPVEHGIQAVKQAGKDVVGGAAAGFQNSKDQTANNVGK